MCSFFVRAVTAAALVVFSSYLAQAGALVVNVAPDGTALAHAKDGDVSSFSEALEVVRKHKSDPNYEGAVIRLRSGVHRISSTIELTSRDSGTPEAPLVIEGEADGLTRLVGSQRFVTRGLSDTERQRAGNLALPATVQAVSMNGQLAGFAANRQARGSTLPPRVTDFVAFDGDYRLTPARWPRSGYAQVLRVDAPSDSAHGIRLFASSELFSSVSKDSDLWASGFWGEEWAQELTRVTNVDPIAGSITLAPLAAPYPAKRGARFFISNALDGLNRPGHFFIDAREGLFLFSPVASDAKAIEIATVTLLVHVKDAHDIQFRNISLERSRGDGIVVEQSSRVTISDCFVGDVGTRGIVVSGGFEDKIIRTVVAGSGETGIELRGGERTTLTRSNHLIKQSVIVDAAQVVRGRRYGILIDGVGQAVEQSLVAALPDQAIWFMGNDHRIDRNIFAAVCTDTLDSGAINSGRDLTARGTIISKNLFYKVHAFSPEAALGIWSIYLDDYISGIRIEQNVFLDADGGVFVNGGRNNVVRDNIFRSILKKPVLIQNLQGTAYSRDAFRPDSLLMTRLNSVPFTSSIYSMRYPNLADLLVDEPQLPKYNSILDNYVDHGRVVHFSRDANRWSESYRNHELPLKFWGTDSKINQLLDSVALVDFRDNKEGIRADAMNNFTNLLFWRRVARKVEPLLDRRS